MRKIVVVTLIIFGTFAGSTASAQNTWQDFPRAFYVEGLDITVSEKELGAEGPYVINGVNLEVRRGEEVVLNETREISGELRAAWVTDLDHDQNPEVTVWVREHGSGGYPDFTLYEINEHKLHTATFPPLTDSQREQYAGHDQITTSPSNIIRQFQTYAPDDPNCCPTGPTTEIIYGFKGKDIVIERSRVIEASPTP